MELYYTIVLASTLFLGKFISIKYKHYVNKRIINKSKM